MAACCRNDAPAADTGEALWLTYDSHIFNPARPKVAMMRPSAPSLAATRDDDLMGVSRVTR